MRNELLAIRELVANHWTDRVAARKADGTPTSSWNPDAVCFCVVGATDKVVYQLHRSRVQQRLDALYEALDWKARELFLVQDIIDVNDDLGQAAVLQVLDALLEEYS